ncbi:alpha/beta hydrolase, partial [Rhizobium johnstonii]
AQADETLSLDGIKLDVTRVVPAGNAAFTVIFIHGRDGDRRLGANYYSFGGNFNRLKNLVTGNGGVYSSPTVRSFDSSGVAAISGLIRSASAQSPGGPESG